ncbi:GNAT family N-acetyltransferase [Erythrobacter gaetbuli]|uniref:GNAT family N-acetyltransferase n=1 Tax=Qipengyuania gaetbuli TaxID=266952 RepID=A0A844XXN9_9SPHN|nr:GNAT family N-acetyltransferase [Qipengyuania gaetbuli]MXO50611.1 GNAT family N-acetyltransferase [Qipengyuania gaetbuli]
MAYSIRPYQDSDAEELADVCRAAIRGIGPEAYSNDQVEAWLAQHPGAALYRERVANGATIFVAAGEDDEPVAYALLEPDGHLDHLYNHPAHTRKGLALNLLATASLYARHHGIKRLYTEASDLARPSFEEAGYIATEKREFEIDGVPIHNWAMEKTVD